MSFEITHWILLIGETACVFGLVAVWLCIILKIIFTDPKSEKQESKTSKTGSKGSKRIQ